MNNSVSRETPPAPEAAVGVFSHTLPIAERFAELLAREGVLRGLIGPREVPRLWDRHLVNCALLGRAIDQGLDVCDLGSGAGLPGLVLALSRPDLSVTLVEPLLRRTTFLEEAVAELGLENVEVVRARAEELHGKREFSVVTSRAVAPLDRLLGWSMPLVRQGGALVAMKGSSVHEEIEQASVALRKYGAGAVTVQEYGADLVERPTIVIRVEATKPSRLGLDAARAPRTKGGRRSTPHRR
ncbi:MAG TPA: 16S rRNA (guanine(527)-N(7))-methyltransferase RsmG, partial [Nocardioidaceae bacterium]